MNYVFSYQIYYIDLCTFENGNKKYYFCKNDENQFINALGIFNSFNDMINCLESLKSLNSSTRNFFEEFDFSNYNENDIMVYPRSVLFKCAIMRDDKYKQEAINHAEKEFLQFNIYEGEIERVA